MESSSYIDLEKLYIILADKQNQDNILVNVTSSKQNMIDYCKFAEGVQLSIVFQKSTLF